MEILEFSQTIYFTIASPPDTTPPVITVYSPLNASYISTIPLLNITSNKNLSSAWYSLNGGPHITLGNTSTTNWNTTISGLGVESTNTLIVYANDTSNNQGNTTLTFYSATVAPSFSNAQVNPSNSNLTQSVNCSIGWSDGFNISSVIISENSLGSYQNHTIAFSGTSGNVSYLIPGNWLTNIGTYTCVFYATDVAGNTNTTSVSFNVHDVMPPIITVISPGNFTYNQNNISISLLANKNLSSAGSVKYSGGKIGVKMRVV